MKALVFLVSVIIFIVVTATQIVFSIQFDQDCGGYLERASNANQLVFALITGHPICGILEAMDFLEMKPVGRHHSGIDDSINEARILIKLVHINRNLFTGMELSRNREKEICSQKVDG